MIVLGQNANDILRFTDGAIILKPIASPSPHI
jgi:hypothetical protein